jgi:hypothetical protein
MVPSILLSGLQIQVTVTSFVRGGGQNTQVQLFSLAGGSSTLIGNMTDDGQNGDKTAGDQVYTIITSLTAPAASSLPLQVVATTGTAGTESANFSVQVVQIPSFSTNTDLNQAESQIYNTAIQTKTSFSSPDWSKPTFLPGFSGNLVAMFSQFAGVVNQNAGLQSSASPVKSFASARPQSSAPHANGIFQSILDVLTFGLLSPAQNANSCNQLVQSLGGFRSSATVPILSLDDPELQQFAQELATICTTAASCQGAFNQDDFLGGNVAAAEWAHEYVVSGQPLPTPIAGCGGGVTQSVASVAVKAEVGQFTDLAGDGLVSAAGGGEISQQLVGQANDTLVGWAVDSSGNPTVVIGQAGANETFAAPTGTYSLATSFGGNAANATITNTPVYPKSTTNISPSTGASITVTPPYVTGLNPATGLAGATVTITGTGFDPNPSSNDVTFNGTAAQVDSSTASSIQTTVPARASSGPISVATSSGSTTSSLAFTVTGSSGTPVATISSLFPNVAKAGAASQLLTINGMEFVLSSTVTFNGVAHAATFVGTNRLTIFLTAADLATAGTYPVVVTNPAPGGGSSNAATVIVSNTQSTNSGQWTWMSGSNSQDVRGVYGSKGIASSSNVPGARSRAVSWTDNAGNLWLFGGNGFDSGNGGNLNDLWKYSPSTNMWTWVSGSQTANAAPVWGTEGIPNASNTPGATTLAVGWTDANGNLWLLDGQGSSSSDAMWRFDPVTNAWTWMSGSKAIETPPTFGTRGVPGASNTPGNRWFAMGWTDANGNLWLFGGFSWSTDASQRPSGLCNDLWEYVPSEGTWTWVNGTQNAYGGVYGTQGIPSLNNIPTSREGATTWTDAGGNLWLFGGTDNRANKNGYGTSDNDLWEFKPQTGMWTWISGSNSTDALGVYGTRGVGAPSNVPGARGAAAGWSDSQGNLWLFGGGGSLGMWNDLWQYSVTNNVWTWVSGSNVPFAAGSYGTQGVSSPINVPPARGDGVGMGDASGRFWLFGGDASDGWVSNDLWQYQP